MTTTAETAKAIRTTLKANYPAVIFSVTSRSFAGGDDVNVSYTDGPTQEAVQRLLTEYEGGTFDGSCDLYEYRKDSPKHPTAKYVFANRHFSPEAYATHRAVVCAKYGIPTDTNDDNDVIQVGGHAYLGQLVTHELHRMDFSEDLTTKITAELIVERMSQNRTLIDAELARRGVLPIDYVGGKV